MARAAVILTLALAAAACVPSHWTHDPMTVFDAPEAYEASAAAAERVAAGDVDGLLALGHSEFQAVDGIRDTADQAFGLLPGDPPFQVDLYYAETRIGVGVLAGQRLYVTVYDVAGDEGFAQLALSVTEEDGVCCVLNHFNVTQVEVPPSSYHAFGFARPTWLHYLVLSLAAGLPALMIVTAVACIRDPDVKGKWFWVPFILIGLWGVDFNWSTGALQPNFFSITPSGVSVKFIKIQLLGSGFLSRGQFNPWIFSLGAPVGAVLYWLGPARRRPPEEPPEAAETA